MMSAVSMKVGMRMSDDTISRKATIDAIEGVDWYHINKDGRLVHGANSDDHEPLYKAKDVYKVLNDVPSAQPEERTEERTETHSCDLIERQAAIDAVYKCADIFAGDMPVMVVKADAYEALAQLPSAQPEVLACGEGELIAQPEIIRCNDCKHWTQTTGNMRGFGLGDCDYINAKLVNCNGFCYWAERRTDG